jgi:hypothetical protein
VGYNVDRVTRRLEKNAQFFKKLPKKSPSQKKAKISTTKLILKAQNIYIKPLLNLKIPTTNHVLKLVI